MCSEHMNNRQLSLARRPRTKCIFPQKKILRFSCALTFNYFTKKLKMKEFGELVANILCFDKQIGISETG